MCIEVQGLYLCGLPGVLDIRDRKKGVITKGVFSMEESLESLKCPNSLEHGRILHYFPHQSGGTLESLESLENVDGGNSALVIGFSRDQF